MIDFNTYLIRNDDITDDNISDFELTLGKKLPQTYKNFLLKSNGGILAYNKFKLNSSEEYHSLYSFDSVEKIEEAWGYLKISPDFFNAEIISIAETLGPPFISIGVGKDNFGQIFVVESDLEVKYQADSFIEFFGQIEFENPIEFPPIQG